MPQSLQPRRKPRSARTFRRLESGLTVEQLEDRVQPSAMHWDSGMLSSQAAADQSAEYAIVPDSPVNPVAMTWGEMDILVQPGSWLVRFDGISGSATEQAAAIQEQIATTGIDISAVQYLGLDGLVQVTTAPDFSYEELVQALGDLPGYRYAEPDFADLSAAFVIPDDPLFPQMWGLHNVGQTGGTPNADIDAPEAWQFTTGSTSVIVGVIDSGMDYTHPDLYLNVWLNEGEIPEPIRSSLTDVDGDGQITFRDLNHPDNAAFVTDLNGNGYIDAFDILNDPAWANGTDTDGNGFVDDLVGWNFFHNTNNPFDDHGHGTHVSGTIGATGNNGLGVTGVNWDILMIPLKFLGPANTGPVSAAIGALNYATMMARDFGFNIPLTNHSWTTTGFSMALSDAVMASGEQNMLVVAAAGNNNLNIDISPRFPASFGFDNVISVAATDHNDLKAGFSNFGPDSVDLAGPGVAILSTVPASGSLGHPSGYRLAGGTSMATPHVAGVAALAWNLVPDASYQDIREIIFRGVDPLASMQGITVTGGRLNAFNTLQQMVDFDIIPFPADFSPVAPLGSLVYQASTTSFITFAGDTDSFELLLDPGQRLSVVVSPNGPSLQPTVEVWGPDGTLVGSATAGTAGANALLNNVATHGQLGSGSAPPKTYRITVSGANGTTGLYDVQVLLNAAFEEENFVGSSNNTIATAENIDGAFVPLLGAVDDPDAGRPERAAVVGSITGGYTVVPGALENVEGNTANSFPFNIGPSLQAMRYQQIYSASEFNVSGIIDALRFRRNQGQAPFSTSNINLQINIGYAATTVATASNVFANNIGPGYITVFDGLLTLSSSGGEIPNFFDIVIDIANLFHYDPSQGDLLVDIFMRNGPVTGFFDVSGLGQQTTTTRIYNSTGNINATTGAVGLSASDPRPYGLVTQFDFAPKPDFYSFTLSAGESATLALTSLAAGGNVNLDLFDAAGNLVEQGATFGPSEELIVNGSFETGNFAGWTTITTGSPFRPWQVTGAGLGGGFGMDLTQPQDGNFVAWNGFDGGGPMEFILHQDVTIPAGIAPILTWRDRIQWNFTLGGMATLPRTYDVEVRDPSTNALLGTLFSFSTGTQATNPTGDTGWTERSADLSAFAGSTVRLVFREFIPQAATGPGQFEIDAISLRQPGEPSNVDAVIRNFVAPVTGTYYVRVSGDHNADYSLVITRNADFDIESNDTIALAQEVGSSHAAGRQWVLGYVETPVLQVESELITFSEIQPGPAHGAVIKGVTFDYRIGGNPSSDATIGITGPATTLYTSAPVLEGSTQGTLTLDFDAPISTIEFGVVMLTGATVPNAVIVQLFDPDSNLIETIPVTIQNEGFGFSEALFSFSGTLVQRVVIDFNQAVASRFALDNIRFEREVGPAFAPNDFFEILVEPGRMIHLETFTPAGKPGEFANTLDPMLRLYDSAGNLVAFDDNSSPDGRNARLQYLVPHGSDGIFYVAVLASDATEVLTSGEYILSIRAGAPGKGGGPGSGGPPAQPGNGGKPAATAPTSANQGAVASLLSLSLLDSDEPVIVSAETFQESEELFVHEVTEEDLLDAPMESEETDSLSSSETSAAIDLVFADQDSDNLLDNEAIASATVSLPRDKQ